MTRIGINARVLEKPELTGVGRYTNCLISALADHTQEFEFVLFGLKTLPPTLRSRENITNANEPASTHSGFGAYIWEQITLPRLLEDHELTLFHTPGGNPPLRADVQLVTTIHDISPIVHPEWFSRKYALIYKILTPLTVRASERILTVSEFARREIIDTYPTADGKVSVVYNGIHQPTSREQSAVENLRNHDFFLFVGSNNPRKNIRRLIIAYIHYRQKTQSPISLVLVGPSRDVFSSFDIPRSDGVETLGFVSDSQLNWLYEKATALVYPSLYEGFGLPIVEAMSYSTPVITSDRGAMAEISGDASLSVDPLNPKSIAKKMETAAMNPSVREGISRKGDVRAKQFTWEKASEQIIEVYRELI